MTVGFSTAVKAVDFYADSMASLRSILAANTSGNIILKGGEYLIDQAIDIKSGQNFILSVDSTSTDPVTFKRAVDPISKTGYFGSLFNINKGASLTFQSDPGKIVIDGGSTDNPRSGVVQEIGFLINNRGETIIDGAEFRNQNLAYGSYVSSIYSNGDSSLLHIKSGSIHDNKITADSSSLIFSSSAILVENQGKIIIDGGKIYNNTIDKTLVKNDVTGVVTISDGAILEMNGGEITGNSGSSGGLMVGDVRFYQYYLKTDSHLTESQIRNNLSGRKAVKDLFELGKPIPKIATAVINGGSISNNTGYANGGGLNVWSAGKVTMNNGHIDNNTLASSMYGSGYGGGVSVIDNYLNYKGGWTPLIANTLQTEWEKYMGAEFIMNGGTINGNKSAVYAGGIFVASNKVQLNSGEIANNTAQLGGGIMIKDKYYTLKLQDVGIMDSKGKTGIETGINGSTYIYEKNGLAFYPQSVGTNTIAPVYDFESYETYDPNNLYGPKIAGSTNLSSRILGGGFITYEGINQDLAYDDIIKNRISVNGKTTDSALQYGYNLSTLRLYNNVSTSKYQNNNAGSNIYNGDGKLVIGQPDTLQNNVHTIATEQFNAFYNTIIGNSESETLNISVYLNDNINGTINGNSVLLETHVLTNGVGLLQVIRDLSQTTDFTKLSFSLTSSSGKNYGSITAANLKLNTSGTKNLTESVYNTNTLAYETISSPMNFNVYDLILDLDVQTMESIIPLPQDIIIEDPLLPAGTEIVEDPGYTGLKEVTTTTPTLNGIKNGESLVSEKIIKEPKARVVRKGTGVVSELVEVKLVPIPQPKDIIIEDSTLPAGTEIVEKTGSDGLKEITTKTPTLNGVPNGSPVITEAILHEAQPKVIRKGVGVLSEIVKVEKVVIPLPKEIFIEDPTLPVGTEIVENQGEPGLKEVTTKTPTFNGVVNGMPVITETILKEAKPKVIRKGTGAVSKIVKVDKVIIPQPKDIIIEDPSLPMGQEIIDENGSTGLKEVITTTPTLNGEPNGVSVVTETIIREPKARVIRKGVGKKTSNLPHTGDCSNYLTMVGFLTLGIGMLILMDLKKKKS